MAAHLYGWKLGLKTGMYYLRTRAAVDALKGLGIDTSTVKPNEPSPTATLSTPTGNSIISEEMPEVAMVKPADSPFECEGCGS